MSAAVTGAAASVIAMVIAGIVYAVAAAAFVYWMRLTGENPVVQNQSFYNGVIVIVLLAVFAVGGGLGGWAAFIKWKGGASRQHRSPPSSQSLRHPRRLIQGKLPCH